MPPGLPRKLASQRGFDGPAEDRGRMIEAFNEWNEEAKELVPAERLLWSTR